VNYALSPKWVASIDARWINIESKASVNGVSVGNVRIDPWVVGAAVGYRF